MADDLEDTIEEVAAGPAEARDQNGSFRAQPLKDLVEADKYLAAKRAAASSGLGIRFGKLRPPGTV